MVGASICGQEHITELVDECIGISTSNLTQNGGGGGGRGIWFKKIFKRGRLFILGGRGNKKI